MAIVTENWSDRSYSRTRATKGYVVTGVANESEAEAAVPYQKGSSHPLNATLIAESPEADSQRGPNAFHVVVTFTTDAEPNVVEDPFTQTPEIDWDIGNELQQFDADVDGNPIVNSAGDPLDPPPAWDVGTIGCVIWKWKQSFNPVAALQFQNTIVAQTFSFFGMFTIDRGQGRCIAIRPAGAYKVEDTEKVRVGHYFEFRKGKEGITNLSGHDGFWGRSRDQGRNSFIVGGDKRKLCDNLGVEVSVDQPLDGTGVPLVTAHRLYVNPLDPELAVTPNPSPPLNQVIEQVPGGDAYIRWKKFPYSTWTGIFD